MIYGLQNEYFEWIYDLVYDESHLKRYPYRALLTHLHNVEFTYILPMDENRAADGIDLRDKFGYERYYSREVIHEYLGDGPCSVLEMMAALALACEEHIMSDPDIGDRTGLWFWGMIDNLGLSDMHDYNFDQDYTDEVIGRLLNREYEPDGTGGLFTVRQRRRDLRIVDIWYQMMWFLNENYVFSI